MAALVIFVDQFTKALVVQNLTPNHPYPVLGEMLKFRLVFNDSAAFSIGFGATAVFAVISTIAALVLLWFLRKIESNSWALLHGIALGGVVGNLIDRLTREPGFGNGRVVDFIQIPFNFPLFNIADTAIVFVATVTVIRITRGHRIGK